MTQIEIDFDVFKQLTALRGSESETFSDVIRALLAGNNIHSFAGAPESQPNSSERDGQKVWTTKGVRFPEETKFRAIYKGVEHHAIVRNGALHVGEISTTSVSKAASTVTGTNVNGWTFWEAQFPGNPRWRPLSSLKKAN